VRQTPATRVFLWPFALLWSVAVRLRAFAYQRGLFRAKRLPGVVMSVGNITVGGTGKTPMVIWICERLRAEGNRVGILTRGYRAHNERGEANSEEAGSPQSDEVALLSERLGHHVSIGVGANRYASGIPLSRHGISSFVLDDGFQHMQLARDVDVVMLDATDPFGGNRLLPAGLLREPKAALRRASVVVISRSTHAPAIETVVQHFTNAPIFYATTELLGMTRAADSVFFDAVAMSRDVALKQSAFAFCGIGNPAAFFDDLSRWGFKVTGRAAFPDHHRYSSADAARIESEARATAATCLICTEKDIFNLRDVELASLPLYSARIQLKLNDADGFWRAVQAVLTRQQKATAA
jgi:tetraacyldisaccharide 4'-kinase